MLCSFAASTYFAIPHDRCDVFFDSLVVIRPSDAIKCLSYTLMSGTILAIQDKHALRNMLLMAAVHYAWDRGNMASFQPTYLFHKLENIHKINAWFGQDSAASATPLCVRHIVSLCLIDVKSASIIVTFFPSQNTDRLSSAVSGTRHS